MRPGQTATYNDLLEAIKDVGMLIVELHRCCHCGKEEIAIHPFCESFNCEWCGKRNMSDFKMYPDLGDGFTLETKE